jgi:hypothetical protein
MRCKCVRDIVDEANRILFTKHHATEDRSVEYFFRGESKNFLRQREGTNLPLGTSFPCCLDRDDGYIDHERDFYQEALRLNIASFEKDQTMVERLGRMQHYQVPTRFCDATTNVLMAAMFACGGGRHGEYDEEHDGYIRVIKAKKERIKSFTSDIIVAIAHLPLVDRKNINPSKKDDGLDYLRYEITNNRPGFATTASPEIKRKLCEEIQHVWAFKPVWNTERIREQSGIFLAFGCRDNKEPLHPTFSLQDFNNPDAPSYGIAQVEVIQIQSDCKSRIREELRYFGVSRELVYSDLSDVAQEITPRYTYNNKGKEVQ